MKSKKRKQKMKSAKIVKEKICKNKLKILITKKKLFLLKRTLQTVPHRLSWFKTIF